MGSRVNRRIPPLRTFRVRDQPGNPCHQREIINQWHGMTPRRSFGSSTAASYDEFQPKLINIHEPYVSGRRPLEPTTDVIIVVVVIVVVVVVAVVAVAVAVVAVAVVVAVVAVAVAVVVAVAAVAVAAVAVAAVAVAVVVAVAVAVAVVVVAVAVVAV